MTNDEFERSIEALRDVRRDVVEAGYVEPKHVAAAIRQLDGVLNAIDDGSLTSTEAERAYIQGYCDALKVISREPAADD